MRRRSMMRLESALEHIHVTSDKTEVYPDPQKATTSAKYKIEFQSNSTLVVTIHFLKALLSPAILAIPSGFRSGGLIFSIFGFLFLVCVVSFNVKKLLDSATYLSIREDVVVRTYDQLAFVSFQTCSSRTKPLARYIKVLVNVLVIVTYLDACSIFMIFMARNAQALINFYFPYMSVSVAIHHYLFLQVIFLMVMSSIRNLKYLSPFSFISCVLLLVVVALTTYFYFLVNIPSVWDRKQIGTILSIPRLTSIVSFSLSGVSISLTLKSSMLHPEHFLGFPGVYCFSMVVFSVTGIVFGYLGYLKFGNETKPSILLNLPVDEKLAISIKVAAMFSTFFASPLIFYVAFNVLWNNYLKTFVNPVNVIFAEFLGRYTFITVSFIMACALPDLGTMIVLKGALLHSHLEITIPAVVEYVAYYPSVGNGKYGFRLIRTLSICLLGIFLSISGTTVAIMDFIREGITCLSDVFCSLRNW